MKLKGRRILIAGSSDEQTTSEGLLIYAHTLVSELASQLADRGSNFVISFGKEPRLKGQASGPGIIFDWTVAEEAEKALTAARAEPSGTSGRLIAAVTTEKTNGQIPEGRLGLFNRLREAGSISMEFVDPGWTAGAIRRQRQAQVGDILIAMSGGEGVEHLAQEFASRGKPVIPLDLALGASSRDGSGGAVKLFRDALTVPANLFRVNIDQSAAELLDRCRCRDGQVPPAQVAASIVHLLEQLKAPRVFYVRILNKDLSENAAVEDFFRNVVDPFIQDIGFEPHEMGVGPNDHAWMNQAIFDDLHHSEAVVVDLTGLRTNCFMELGYALGNVQRVVIAAQKGTLLPFDSSCLETHMWNPAVENATRRSEFQEHWTRNINRPPLVKPRGLR